MNLTQISLGNRITVLTLVGLAFVYGILTYGNLPKQQDPGFTIRAAVITTRFPGASPKRVEQLISDKIEKAIQEIPELDTVTSESKPGLSFVTAEFQERYTDMRPLFDKLRRKVEGIRSELPDGIQAPNVNDEYGDVFGSVYGLTGEGFSYAELKDIADEVRDRLLKIPEIAKVEIKGAQEEEIFVEYSTARLKELGLSPQQLSQALSAVNIVRSGGNILTGRERIVLEPSGNFETLNDLGKTVIQLPRADETIYLENIADIRRGYKDPPRTFARVNGQPALILAISMREGGNVLELGQILDREIPAMELDYPIGIQFHKIFFQAKLVDNSVKSFINNLLQAIGIVVAVMLLFLGLRTGLIVAALVPTTIFAAIVLMGIFDITINQISLAALIISLGLLVDNAIVIAESILTRRESGEESVTAAIGAGKEMAVPLLVSSLTTSAAFLPIFLAESAVGEYTADIFKVVTIALLSSWMLAMTFIPLLTVMFMKIKSRKQELHDGFLYRFYQGLLLFSVRNRLLFLLIVAGIFYSAIWALQFVPNVFIPPRTDPVINAKFNMPRGTAIETTENIASQMSTFLQQNHLVSEQQMAEGERGILSWATFVGEGAPRYTLALDPGSSEASSFNMIINTTDHLFIPEVIENVQNFASENFPDLEVQMKELENGTPIPYPIEVRVSGPDTSVLYDLIEPIKEELLSSKGVLAINDDWGPRSKKLLIEIDQDRARRAGVTNDDVAISLEAGLSGIELTEFREDDSLIPVTMRSVAADRQDIGKLEGMNVYSQTTGNIVPLKQVADINIAWQPAIIKRRDRNRSIAVRAQLLPGYTATDINTTLLPWIEEQSKQWPRLYSYEIGGESETSDDANQAIADKLGIAGMLILLLLVAQFNNLRKPIIILTTIPLGLIGVIYGLLIANSIFGFFTILGLVSLSGIIINNAIVLIDRINIEIEQNGLEPANAVITACKQRLRPILLTTATTAGGMLPLWISHDPMFETMAVSIIFGLIFATLLTLLFVPVLYSLFFRVRFKDYKPA